MSSVNGVSYKGTIESFDQLMNIARPMAIGGFTAQFSLASVLPNVNNSFFRSLLSNPVLPAMASVIAGIDAFDTYQRLTNHSTSDRASDYLRLCTDTATVIGGLAGSGAFLLGGGELYFGLTVLYNVSSILATAGFWLPQDMFTNLFQK